MRGGLRGAYRVAFRVAEVVVDDGELAGGEEALVAAVAGGAEGGEEFGVAVNPAAEAVEGTGLGHLGGELPGEFGFGEGG